MSPTAEWGRVSDVYGQGLSCLRGPGRHLPEALPAFLAELFARQSVMYQGYEDELIRDGVEVLMRHHEGRSVGEVYLDIFKEFPPHFHEASQTARRRPLPLEAFVETSRRLRDLNDLERRLSRVTVGGVLGGSMSYGRFYNVRGGSRGVGASDLDLMVVVASPTDIPAVVDQMSDIPSVDTESLEAARERVGSYLRGIEDGDITSPSLISQKFALWTNQTDPFLVGIDTPSCYETSLHILATDTFYATILRDKASAEQFGQEERSIAYDYRESEPNREDQQRSFSGEQHNLGIDCNSHEGSYVRQTHLYYVDDSNRYFPGMVQNLILPGFDVVWGNRDFRRSIDTLRWKMIERLRIERRDNPNQMLRLSLSHTRSHEFAPYIVRAVDSSTLVP